jgi:hypothetical protein
MAVPSQKQIFNCSSTDGYRTLLGPGQDRKELKEQAALRVYTAANKASRPPRALSFV